MKQFVKKILKILLIFLISTITIYLTLTIGNFINWCHENQIPLFKHYEARSAYILNLDAEKIQEMGIYVGAYQETLQQPLAEWSYDPVGFSVWLYIDSIVQNLLEPYVTPAILLGLSISIAYAVITSKKMKNTLKFILGYWSILLFIPPIYKYSYTYRFWSITETYFTPISIKFYIIYTIIFLLLFAINYRISKKIAQELNETIKNQ